MEPTSYPFVIYIISGKRKSGKDYISELLQKEIGVNIAVLLHTANPIKKYWAEKNNLSYEDLLTSSSYKEKYREGMVEWGMQVRANDYGYFCRAAIEMNKAKLKPVWIVADVRHKTDIKWFTENYPEKVKTVRVLATTETRVSRGWFFKKGVDDIPSECEMDDYIDWDLVIHNDIGKEEHLKKQISTLRNMLSSCRLPQ